MHYVVVHKCEGGVKSSAVGGSPRGVVPPGHAREGLSASVLELIFLGPSMSSQKKIFGSVATFTIGSILGASLMGAPLTARAEGTGAAAAATDHLAKKAEHHAAKAEHHAAKAEHHAAKAAEKAEHHAAKAEHKAEKAAEHAKAAASGESKCAGEHKCSGEKE